MGKRRGRRTRSDVGGNRVNVERAAVLPQMPRYNQYTVEGQIERWGMFAAGVNRARGWKRIAGRALVIMFLVPFGIMIVNWVVMVVSR